MITDERADKALEYLIQTDERAAKAKAHMEGMAEKRRMVKATCYLESIAKSSADREAVALASEQYAKVVEEYENAIADYELLRNRRESAEIILRTWQTESANRRQGNIK